MRKTISKSLRKQVYDKYNGHCAYCGCKLDMKDMQVDHIISINDKCTESEIKQWKESGKWKTLNKDDFQDDSIDNLNPACRMCNFYKSDLKLEDFRNRLTETLMRNVRKPFDYRMAIKYGLITETIHPIKFYFEK